MNFDDTPQEAAFRAEAKAWIAANAPKQYEDELSKSSLGRTQLKGANILEVAKAWQKKKADAGWACLHWPKEYGGRGATPIERVIWQQEEGPFGKLSGMFIIGHGMCGPTMMAFASEEQKRRYLPPLASGENIWCQLFSEPAGGSDVAGLRTRAEKTRRRLDHQRPEDLDLGRALFRLRHPAHAHRSQCAKHKGLTMFFLDMKSPGVEIKPIKQANGQSDFNEVYFTDVKIPDAQRLGAVNDGWNVSLTTLMNERMSIGARCCDRLSGTVRVLQQSDAGGRAGDRRPQCPLQARQLGGARQRTEIHQHARDLGAVEGRASGTGEFDRQAGRGIDDPGYRGLCAGPAGCGGRAERAGGRRSSPENSRRCCCARPAPASKAAPTRSCATSSPSACSDCPATSGSTRMCRSTRYRPRDEHKESISPRMRREPRNPR